MGMERHAVQAASRIKTLAKLLSDDDAFREMDYRDVACLLDLIEQQADKIMDESGPERCTVEQAMQQLSA